LSITVQDLHFGYGERQVLRGVSFTAPGGQLTSILGPNGVGKSTLFRCLLGLLHNYTGSITIDGLDTRHIAARELAKHVAYIPQSHYPSFNYSVYNMVLMGTTSQISMLSSPGQKQKEAAMAALEQMGVGHLKDQGYTNISGGERQLVLIARALVQKAKVLILDEPTANLDYGNQLHVMEQVRKLTANGYTVIQSTHNPEQAFLYSHNIVAMKDGQVLAEGAPTKVVTEELMARLYGAEIRVCSLYDDKIRICIPSSVADSK